MTPLLEVTGLRAGYGKVEVVHGLDLQVQVGEVVALLGPNGAGKTTTLTTVAGELPPLGGTVRLLDCDRRDPLHIRARKGLAMVTQERAVLMDLTLADNLKVSRCDLGRAMQLFPELEEHLGRRVGLLSGGQQQMLALARCLARDARLLLVDELSLGLAPLVVDRLLRAVRAAADDGLGVLLVEQHVHKALAVADRVLVMRRGVVELDGAAADLRQRVDEIQAAYLQPVAPVTRRMCVLVAAALGAAAAAGCGDGKIGGGAAVAGGAAGDGPRPTQAVEASSSEAAECPGEPLRFTTIAALSGPVARGGQRYRLGTDAAVAAVNRECSLGRPIEVAFCDDASDVNTNLACGRQAASDGSLALLSTVGSFDDGAAASGLPGVFLYGTSAFELTNPNVYSSISGISIGMAGVTAAAARGASTFLLVLPDSPALQFVAVQVEAMAQLIDIELEVIYFPIDTTDYAPIAAQISQRQPDAVGMLPASPVVMINALADEGITPQTHVMSIASIVLTPEIIAELGPALDGMMVVSQTVPPNTVDNPGIAEFRADLEAVGHDPDDPTIDFTTVIAWSNVKKLEAALLAAGGPSYVADLTSESLVRALVEHPIARPEAAPYDFRANQITELPGLASFRVFTREVALLEIQDGAYELLAEGFVDILEPPDLG